MAPTLICGIGTLVTMAPLAQQGRATSISDVDLGIISNAWLAIDQGKVIATGTNQAPQGFEHFTRHHVHGALVMPGLVDAHSHLLFAGSRADEFARRCRGETYQEIAAAGGGIGATMRATRAASDEQLLSLLQQRLARARQLGITTVEIKSGYGLSVDAELRLLRLLKRARTQTRQTLSISCLALHAASPQHTSLEAYAAACTEELLPVVAQESLADAVDAFIEAGYFSPAQVSAYARRARDLGLAIRLHADEFSDAGGASAAADWGAASADHLQFASEAGVRHMAAAGVSAVVLPGTSLYTKIPFTHGRRFADAGCPVAIATDFNPGSCQIDNLAMLAAVAAVQCGLRPAEAVAGVTYVAAHALGLATRKGALCAGYDGDFQVIDLPDTSSWLADFGRTLPREVWIGGHAS